VRKKFWNNLWELLKPYHKKISGVVFLIVVVQWFGVITPYFLKLVIDLITNFNSQDIFRILVLTGAIFISEQLGSLIRAYSDKMSYNVLANVENYLSVRAQEKMVNLSLAYHERENTGSKISKIQRGIYGVLDLLSNFIWEIAPTIFKVVITSIVLFITDYRFGLVFIFFVPIFLYVSYKYNLRVSPMRKKRYDAYEKSAGMMAQSIININTVKSFAKEDFEILNFKKNANKITKNALYEYALKVKYAIGRNLIVDLGKGFVLLFGVYLIANNDISVGTFVFVFTVSDKALLSLYSISRLYDRVMESSEGILRLSTLFSEKIEIESKHGGKKVKKLKGYIEFKNVEFSYDETGARALHNASINIDAGAMVALIGPSGGGKTTMARMIYRHYDPQKGKILLDGINLKEYDLYSMRKRMAIVPQEVEIFNATIKENISYAYPKASINLVKKSAMVANAHEFISSIENGYSAIVGERGVKLSGGQRQRIGIARAILSNPDILVFDEATSNLDSESENLIQSALEKISKNRTTIVIAHRLSTVEKADKIIVLKKGRIVEVGTHSGLAKKKAGLYRELLNLQRIGEIE